MLVVAVQLPERRVVHGFQHRRIVVPIVRVGEINELDVFCRHAVHLQHRQDGLCSWMRHQSFFKVVEALGNTDLLPLRSLIR